MQGTAREGTVAVRSASDVESRTQAIGRELLAAMRGRQAGLMSGRFWSDKLMDWALRDPAFKVQMFRFVDVFPMLHTPAQVHEYLADYLTQPGVSLPPGMELGLKAGRVAKGLMARSISASIGAMAGTFIAGRDAATAVDVLRKLWKEGAGFTVDLLGEACVSDEEARAYQRRYLDLLEFLPGAVARWPADAAIGPRSSWPAAARRRLDQAQCTGPAAPIRSTSRARSTAWWRRCGRSWKRRHGSR